MEYLIYRATDRSGRFQYAECSCFPKATIRMTAKIAKTMVIQSKGASSCAGGLFRLPNRLRCSGLD